MAVPMLVPSLRMWLALIHASAHPQLSLLAAENWVARFGGCLPLAPQERAAVERVQRTVPTPSIVDSSAASMTALQFYLRHANVYELPHVIYFDDLPSLFDLLNSTDFVHVSAQIYAAHQSRIRKISEQWSAVLAPIDLGMPHHHRHDLDLFRAKRSTYPQGRLYSKDSQTSNNTALCHF